LHCDGVLLLFFESEKNNTAEVWPEFLETDANTKKLTGSWKEAQEAVALILGFR
jgi:hypothetical protein